MKVVEPNDVTVLESVTADPTLHRGLLPVVSWCRAKAVRYAKEPATFPKWSKEDSFASSVVID